MFGKILSDKWDGYFVKTSVNLSRALVCVMLVTACASTPKTKEGDVAAEQPSASPTVVEAELNESTKLDLDSEKDAQIPKEVNDLVLKWVDYFTGKGRKHMVRYLSRSSRYVPLMKDILKKSGMPEDLVYLALIESGFNGTVRSHASAVGFWQFMRPTGKNYGLKVNSLVDERRDFVRSTEAASAYLKGLYNLFGSWYLAIASYNVGENRVKSVVMRSQTRDFWTLARKKQLPLETIDYVPKFIAARMIAKHPEKFGLKEVEFMPPLEFETISVDRPVSLRLLSLNAGLDLEEMRDLNPMYRSEFVPVEEGTSVELRVPKGKVEVATNSVEKSAVNSKRMVAKVEAEDGVRKHKIRKGDTLGGIARRYGVSLSALRDANDFGRKPVLRVGSTINVPSRRRNVASRERAEIQLPKVERRPYANNSKLGKAKLKAKAKMAKVNSRSKSRASDDSDSTYVVRRGDTLRNIAMKYRVELHSLIAKNKLQAQVRLQPGKRLLIPE